MKISLIDIGSNLTHASFDEDRDAVVARALRAGVRQQIVTGADLPSSRQAAALAAAAPSILSSTAGVHPHQAAGFDLRLCGELTEILQSPHVVAVGECGLDYFRDLSPRDVQRRIFTAQLDIASAVGKPVFLHQREAHEDFRAILREYRPRLVGGVAHCFTGGRSELEDYLALDLFIGVTGWVNDPRRGQRLRDAIAHIPADRLMLETDAPYLLPRDMAPQPRSRRNEPGFLPHIAQTVADLRAQTLAAVAESTSANAARLFSLPDARDS